MLKIAGALTVLCASAAIGFYKAMRLRRRCDSLEKLMLCAEHIGAEIAFAKKRVERIFNETGREYGMDVFSAAALKIHNEGVRDAWSAALLEYASDMALTSHDVTAAELLGSGVGDFTGQEQQKSIRTAGRMLELALASAREEYERMAKLYQSGGALLGMLAVILLL